MCVQVARIVAFVVGMVTVQLLAPTSIHADESAPPPAETPAPSDAPAAPSQAPSAAPPTGSKGPDRASILNQYLPTECQLGYVTQVGSANAKSPEEQFATLRVKRKIIINCVRQGETASQEMSASVIDMSNALSDLKGELNDFQFGPKAVPAEDQLQRWVKSAELEKANLTQEIDAAKGMVVQDDAKIRELTERLTSVVDQQKSDQEMLDNYNTIRPAFDAEIKARQDAIKALQGDIDRKKSEQKTLGNALYLMGRDLDETDNQISQLTTTTTDNNNYKTNITLAFTLLVGIVIGGFFWLANKTPDVAKQIFANDSGIQFITLFSLVIAIILFGVIGVLEGKELAALLAGLSGYILGRANSAAKPNVPNDPPQPQPQ